MTAARRALALILPVLVLPAVAGAHVERSAYWPDPAPDCATSPCAGGAVPIARSLSSALVRNLPGSTRVVCRPNSMSLLKRSITRARAHGYDIRPSDHRTFSKHA